MSFFKTKLEYLEFEQDCRYVMDRDVMISHRREYGITEEDLTNFYGNHYPYKPKVYKKSKKKIKEKFQKEQVQEQLELFEHIFDGKDESFIKIFCKETEEYYCYPVAALLDSDKLYAILNSHRFKTINDLMYSLNTYNNMYKHDSNNIFTLNSFAIDVDFKECSRLKDKTIKQVIKMLEKIEFGKTIPSPNIIEYGNNIRLIYILDKAYSTKNVNTLVSRICRVIGERLADYKAKGQPITTFARVLNSVNSRNNKRIKAMYLDVPKYKIKYLQKTVLPPLPQWYAEYKQKSKRKKTKIIQFTTDFEDRAKARKYNLNRIQDFFRIQEYFGGDLDGKRYMCFQVRNHAKLAGYSNDEAEEILKDFNDRFRYPLRWNVIEQDTRNVERRQYYYKSVDILDYLGIDEDLELLLELKAILSPKEKARRHNEREKARQKAKYRNEEDLTNTEVKRRNQFILIARMELMGMSYKAIALELGYKDHTPVIKKVNRMYDKINYNEILEEVKQGLYDDIKVAIG